MSNVDVPHTMAISERSARLSTSSFGRHRLTEIPASAVRAGASVEPSVFRQHHASATSAKPRSPHDEPATLLELALRPYHRVFGHGGKGKIAAGVLLLVVIGVFAAF